MRFFSCLLFIVFICFLPLNAQTPEFVKQIHAIRVDEQMHIDGVLSESVWQRVGTTAFFQQEPNQGQAVSESTEVWVEYDNEAPFF